MQNLFDPDFSALTRSEMYRSWVYPDLYPDERQAVLKNWSDDDIAMFCGTRKVFA